jgi:hypothetical protein
VNAGRPELSKDPNHEITKDTKEIWFRGSQLLILRQAQDERV